jgi:hypothetical protein
MQQPPEIEQTKTSWPSETLGRMSNSKISLRLGRVLLACSDEVRNNFGSRFNREGVHRAYRVLLRFW